MALFDDASLVVTPNGYKEGTLYSIKPTSGAGDMTVVRATTATRVNSAGLIELVPYNLLTYSEQFNNADWSVQDATITANTTTAPNGTLTADTFTRTASTGFLYSTNPLSLNTGSYSHSFYAKANTISSFRLDLVTAGFSQGVTCVFDLSNGTAGTPILYGSASSFVATIENVGNGWYRCSLSGNVITGNYYAELAITTTGSIFIWGAQLNEGTIKDYLRTETRLNIPRLDYSNGTCPSILVEPQRTNVNLYSEDLTNAWYNKFNSSISANAITAPTGTTTADKVVEDTSNGYHYIETTNVLSLGQTYTVSCFLKKAERTFGYIGVYTFESKQIRVNLTTGVIENTVGTWISTSIEDYGNGWYRVVGTFSALVATYFFTGPALNATTVSYTGDGTSGIYVWGAQLEVGSYPTSYIPTTSAAVTRNADAIYKTGISSLIGQTEGVMFIDFVWNQLTGTGSYPRIIELGNNSNNYIQLFSIAGTTTFLWEINNGGVVQFSGSSTMALGRNKLALAYKLNDCVFYKNGSLIASDATCTIPATNALGICGVFDGTGGAQLSASVNSAILFPTRLTNAELISLTTI
jgi:hypothetical protein